MSGEAQFSFATLTGAMSQVKAGNLRALAVTTQERSPQLPDVPALGENAAFKGYDINTWNALLAPKGTPQAVVDTLNAAIRKAMGSPSLRQHFEKEGAVPRSEAHTSELQSLMRTSYAVF